MRWIVKIFTFKLALQIPEPIDTHKNHGRADKDSEE